jgi:hypothetical protein
LVLNNSFPVQLGPTKTNHKEAILFILDAQSTCQEQWATAIVTQSEAALAIRRVQCLL